MVSKVCTKCGEEKELNNFYANKRGKDGKQACCILCHKKYQEENKGKIKNCSKKYYQENKEKIKKHRDEHKEKYKNYQKKYYLEHQEESKIKQKKYRKNHKDEIKIRDKKYQEEHKEEKKIYDKKYELENKNKRRIQKKKYINNRRKTDVRFKISGNLRCRVRCAIKGDVKSLSTMMLVGCGIDYLLFRLQSQFQSGMSWNNYGKWEIDHIKPCSSFDLSKETQQRKCFHYTNLQPLWAKDNLLKSNKYED